MDRDDQAEILSYLLASARGCIDEPPLYGPLRLLDAYSLLLGMLSHGETDEFYYELDKMIGEFKDKCMSDKEQFAIGLDRVHEILSEYIANK